jgi:hypothetical protein
MVRRIYGPNRKEVPEGLRKLHNEDLRNLYSSENVNQGNQIEEDEWHM